MYIKSGIKNAARKQLCVGISLFFMAAFFGAPLIAEGVNRSPESLALFIGDQTAPPPIWETAINVYMMAEDHSNLRSQDKLWQAYSMLRYFADASDFSVSPPVLSGNGQQISAFTEGENEINYLIVVWSDAVLDQKINPEILERIEADAVNLSSNLEGILHEEFVKDEVPFQGKIYPDEQNCLAAGSHRVTSLDHETIIFDAFIIAMDEDLTEDEQFACISNRVLLSFGMNLPSYPAIIGNTGHEETIYSTAPIALYSAGWCRRLGLENEIPICYKRRFQGSVASKYNSFVKGQ